MRVIILLLLFLYTILPYTFFTLAKRFHVYFYLRDLELETGKLLLKELSFGANNVFGRNFSFYTEELSLGKEVKLKNTFVNIISFKKPKKKERFS